MTVDSDPAPSVAPGHDEPRDLQKLAVDFGLVAAGLALGYFIANRNDAKKRRWFDKLAEDKCPWDSQPIIRPEDGNPLWYCTRHPEKHNEDQKRWFFLL
jgi:hypothetical protein